MWGSQVNNYLSASPLVYLCLFLFSVVSRTPFWRSQSSSLSFCVYYCQPQPCVFYLHQLRHNLHDQFIITLSFVCTINNILWQHRPLQHQQQQQTQKTNHWRKYWMICAAGSSLTCQMKNWNHLIGYAFRWRLLIGSTLISSERRCPSSLYSILKSLFARVSKFDWYYLSFLPLCNCLFKHD